AVTRQIHPSVFQDIVRGVGAEHGGLAASEWRLTHGTVRLYDSHTGVQCLKAVAQQCGWKLQVAVESADVLRITILECRYTEPRESGWYLCELAAGLFAGVVAETIGYAKVSVGPCSETPPLDCAFTIYLRESEEHPEIPDIVHPYIEKKSVLFKERALNGVLDERLTPCELQVLRLIAQGLSDKQIAASLQRSVRTVENHAARIRQKLRIGSRTGLVRFAFRTRLIEL
ncbi:MAG: response regulator transcription factor, partial [candidate division NC10 bacterium]|nr:response regulator transcription factor [candidate division NC10 bacterium]